MDKHLRRLDAISITLLLLWLGMALGFGALMAPALFANLPSRDLAGKVAGVMVTRLDWAAWIAFGGALLLSFGGRWFKEIEEPGPVGPLKLWTATALTALLFTFASTFITTAKLRELRTQMRVAVETLPEDDPQVQAYRKAHKFSTQFFVIRMVLAAALAWGAGKLPMGTSKDEKDLMGGSPDQEVGGPGGTQRERSDRAVPPGDISAPEESSLAGAHHNG